MSAPRPGRLRALGRIGRQALGGAGNLVRRSFGPSLEPRRIWFEVTDRCNSRCTHCSIWQRRPDTPPLTLAEIERTFRDPLFRNIEAIINSGGEPALREDMVEILRLEHRLFPRASLDYSTNGLMPERAIAVAKAMVEDRIPLEIGLSLDGVGERHDAFRGCPGNFAKVDYLLGELQRLRTLAGGLIEPCIGFTLSPLTLDNYEEVRAYAAARGVPLEVQWYNNSSFYENTGHAPSEAEKARMDAIVRALPRGLLNDRWLGWLAGERIDFACFAMHRFCVLKANGEIVPCLNHWHAVAGNVREQSPSAIWRGLAATHARGLVRRCPGCLNSWGVGWSALYAVYPNWLHYLRNPDALKEKLGRFLPGAGNGSR